MPHSCFSLEKVAHFYTLYFWCTPGFSSAWSLEFGFLASFAAMLYWVPLLHLQLGTLFQHLGDTHKLRQTKRRPGERGARGGGATDWGGSGSKKKRGVGG